MAENNISAPRVPQGSINFRAKSNPLTAALCHICSGSSKISGRWIGQWWVQLLHVLSSVPRGASYFVNVKWSTKSFTPQWSPRPYVTSQMWLLCLTGLTCWADDCLNFLVLDLLFQRRKVKTAEDCSGNPNGVIVHYAACLRANWDRAAKMEGRAKP